MSKFILKYRTAFSFLILIVVCSTIAYFIFLKGSIAGILAIVFAVGVPVALASVRNMGMSLMATVFMGSFLFLFQRLLPGAQSLGITVEVFLWLGFASVILRHLTDQDRNWKSFSNPITFIYAMWIGFALLQAINPSAVGITPWLMSIRGIIIVALTYIVAMKAFDKVSFISTFTKFVLAIAVLAGAYSVYQEYFGFFDFEWRWLYEDPTRYNRLFNWGRWRKWSFMSDPSVFGLFMAFSSVTIIILLMGPYKTKSKIILAFSLIFTIMGVLYSGTRTSMAIVPIGVLLFIFMTITQKKTLIFAVAAACLFLGVLFGPFYAAPIIRMRSAFLNVSDDGSFKERDRDRERSQPYILSHPIGGGVNTVGAPGMALSPGHPLAGFEPDSGYVKVALEKGSIGLLLTILMYAFPMCLGIHYYYHLRDPVMRNILAAYICAFFALSIGHFSQDSLGAKPINIILYSFHALIIKIGEHGGLRTNT